MDFESEELFLKKHGYERVFGTDGEGGTAITWRLKKYGQFYRCKFEKKNIDSQKALANIANGYSVEYEHYVSKFFPDPIKNGFLIYDQKLEDENNFIILRKDYEGGILTEQLENSIFGDEFRIELIYFLIDKLKYLYNNGLYHRDMHVKNIFYFQRDCMEEDGYTELPTKYGIIDFGNCFPVKNSNTWNQMKQDFVTQSGKVKNCLSHILDDDVPHGTICSRFVTDPLKFFGRQKEYSFQNELYGLANVIFEIHFPGMGFKIDSEKLISNSFSAVNWRKLYLEKIAESAGFSMEKVLELSKLNLKKMYESGELTFEKLAEYQKYNNSILDFPINEDGDRMFNIDWLLSNKSYTQSCFPETEILSDEILDNDEGLAIYQKLLEKKCDLVNDDGTLYKLMTAIPDERFFDFDDAINSLKNLVESLYYPGEQFNDEIKY